MKTADLIAALAADNPTQVRPISQTMGLAVAAAGLVAAIAFSAATDIRPDIATALTDPRFLLKPLAMGLMALTAVLVVRRLASPEGSVGRLALLLAIVPAMLLTGVGIELAVIPAEERWTNLVGTGFGQCVGLITLIGCAPLALILWGLKQGAPANPRLAGGMAGVAAAGIAAVLYAVHCPNDSPFYVAAWYSTATLILAGAGAFAGARLLRW